MNRSKIIILHKTGQNSKKKSTCFRNYGYSGNDNRVTTQHTNNEINLKKNHETYTRFSAVVGGQHIVKWL